MPKNPTKHIDYTDNIADWEQIKTCLKGESAVKKQGETYLPFPVALTSADRNTQSFKDEYAVYLNGAHYVNFTLQAVEDLVAGVFRKAPVVENVPSELEYIEHEDFSKDAVEIVTSYGRGLALVDYPRVNGDTTVAKEKSGYIRAYYQLYKADDILDWETTRKGGVEILSMVLLREIVTYNEGDDRKQGYRYRKLYLKDGVYTVDLFYSFKDEEENDIVPQTPNGTLDHIPATFIGSKNNTPKVNTSPIMGISNSNIKHYQTWGELKHIETYAGHPMLAITGAPANFIKEMKKEDLKISVGASQALILEGDSASANILTQANESNIIHFKELEVLKNSMQEQGARIKDNGSAQVESADTLTIKYSGDNSILASIAINVEMALLFVYEQAGLFMNVGTDAITANINKSFFEKKADAGLVTALNSLVSSGNLPNRIQLGYLKEHNVISTDEDIDALVIEAQNNNPFNNNNEE